jgi:hypothetical protein
MEYEQRIIMCLANDGFGADEIGEKLSAQFAEDAYSLLPEQFWIAEVKRGREDLYDEHRQRDILLRIWQVKFKRCWITVRSTPRD